MSDETVPKGLTLRPDGTIAPRDKRAEIRSMMETVLREDLDVVEAAHHAFDDDVELEKLPPKVQKIARAGRLPRSEAPVALTTAHERVMAMMRRDTDQPKVTLNVESMSIQLPEKAPAPREDAVVIDVEETIED